MAATEGEQAQVEVGHIPPTRVAPLERGGAASEADRRPDPAPFEYRSRVGADAVDLGFELALALARPTARVHGARVPVVCRSPAVRDRDAGEPIAEAPVQADLRLSEPASDFPLVASLEAPRTAASPERPRGIVVGRVRQGEGVRADTTLHRTLRVRRCRARPLPPVQPRRCRCGRCRRRRKQFVSAGRPHQGQARDGLDGSAGRRQAVALRTEPVGDGGHHFAQMATADHRQGALEGREFGRVGHHQDNERRARPALGVGRGHDERGFALGHG